MHAQDLKQLAEEVVSIGRRAQDLKQLAEEVVSVGRYPTTPLHVWPRSVFQQIPFLRNLFRITFHHGADESALCPKTVRRYLFAFCNTIEP